MTASLPLIAVTFTPGFPSHCCRSRGSSSLAMWTEPASKSCSRVADDGTSRQITRRIFGFSR